MARGVYERKPRSEEACRNISESAKAAHAKKRAAVGLPPYIKPVRMGESGRYTRQSLCEDLGMPIEAITKDQWEIIKYHWMMFAPKITQHKVIRYED